jgi:hypothetical protein
VARKSFLFVYTLIPPFSALKKLLLVFPAKDRAFYLHRRVIVAALPRSWPFGLLNPDLLLLSILLDNFF